MTLKNLNPSIQTRNLSDLISGSGNLYASVAIIGRRANHIAIKNKEDLMDKLTKFNQDIDANLEEVHENREQIEISKMHERLPKPAIVATEEFLDGKLAFRKREKNVE